LAAHASRGAPAEHPNARLGLYRLLSVLGEGSFGVVWLAEQNEPVRRRVALKVIKAGMDSRDILARFDQERQALALMDHPGIAKVFDGGVTPAQMGGRPFFVMELVAGESITAFCDRERLDLRRRIELFARVCDAVQHAHQKGIVHRDIKPSNILVAYLDAHPAPKIIDFGVAKALHRPLTEKTLFTETGRLIGTPEYMSPEQAEMSPIDIDTRSDIYSLGVLLYELLTGTLPFDPRELRSAGIREIQRMIREVEPPKPSTRLSTLTGREEAAAAAVAARSGVEQPSARARPPRPPRPSRPGELGSSVAQIAKARHTDPRSLARRMRRDLDWVVMKCLEKERNRRYPTANELAADLRRFLEDQPVSAGAPGVRYRAAKFVRRNRLPVAAAAAVAVAVIAAMVVSLAAWRSESRQRQIAQERTAEAERGRAELDELSLFQAGIISRTQPASLGRGFVRALRDDLNRASPGAGAGTDERLAYFDALMAGASGIDAARAVMDSEILAPAVEAAAAQFGGRPILMARMSQTLANAYVALGMLEKARPLQEQALQLRRRALSQNHPSTLISIAALGEVYGQLGRTAEAETLLKEALDGREKALGANHPETLATLADLGAIATRMGKYDEAERYFVERLARVERSNLATDDLDAIDAMVRVGGCRLRAGDYTEAEKLLTRAIDTYRRAESKREGGATSTPASMKRADSGTGAEPAILDALSARAVVFDATGREPQAEADLKEALDRAARHLGETHPDSVQAAKRMVRFFDDTGRLPESIRVAARLSTTLVLLRRFAEAEQLMLPYSQHTGLRKVDRAAALGALIEVYAAWDKADPAADHAEEVEDLRARLARAVPPAEGG